MGRSEEELRELQADIEQRSSQRPGSGTPEDLSDAAKQAHLAKQGATSPAAFTGEPPNPQEFKDPAELMGQVSEAEPDFSHFVNPHAMRMVAQAEATGEPLFCFRARDIFSIQVLVHYANIVEQYGPDNPDFLHNIVDGIGEFKEWQKEHIGQVRYPD